MRSASAPWPHLDESRYFVSGANHAGEIRGLAAAGCNVGFAADEVVKGGPGSPAELALYTLEGQVGIDSELRSYKRRVFGDTGAFGEVQFGAAGPYIAKPIAHVQWLRRLELFGRLAIRLGPQFHPVAPDCVGHQKETLERMAQYRRQVQALHSLGAHVIVPVQQGAQYTMTQFFELACATLRLPPQDVIAGIPSKKAATSTQALAEFCADLPKTNPPRIHLLGLGPKSPRYASVMATVREHAPEVEVFCDSVRITALVGRTNGPGGGPRALTAARDALMAGEMRDTAQLKEAAIRAVWAPEDALKLEQAVAAGWYDAELLDGPAKDLADYMRRVEEAARTAENQGRKTWAR